jgi:hypothetical protein
MHFQFVVAPPSAAIPAPPSVPPTDPTADLLREMIMVQKEQLNYARATFETQNNNARWINFLKRWSEDYPGIGKTCQDVMPVVERAFVEMLGEVTDRLSDVDDNPLGDEYQLAEFLDRYGVKLGQLGSVLNVIGPIADASRSMGE